MGREKERARLLGALREALRGPGRLHLVVGEPGIGKTRLMEEVAEAARAASARVLWGRCYEEQGTPPHWPWLKALEPYVDDLPLDELESHLGARASLAATILPQIRARIPGLAPFETASRDPEADTFRAYDAAIGFLLASSLAAPLVVALDDLHWADEGSLRLLVLLARQLDRSRLFVLGSYRDVELDRKHPLAGVLGELARYLEVSGGLGARDGFAGRMHEVTEGNPLFVREVAQSLRDEGGSPAGSADPLPARVPEGVREAIGRRLSRLSAETGELLATAAVLGQELDIRKLRACLAEWPESRLLETIDEVTRAQILREVTGTPGTYRFSHALVRETVLEELSLTQRVRAHAAVAKALESIYTAQERQANAAELLGHFGHAQTLLGGAKVAEYALSAARTAASSYAYGQVRSFCSQGLEAARGTPMDDTQAELHVAAAEARGVEGWMGPGDKRREHLEAAITHWEATGQNERIVRELVRPEVVAMVPRSGLSDRVLRDVEPGSREEAHLLAYEGSYRAFFRRDAPWRPPLDRALEIVAADPHPPTAVVVHACHAWASFPDGLWDEMIEHGHEAIRLGREVGDWAMVLEGRAAVSTASRCCGKGAEAWAQVDRMLQEAERLGDHYLIRKATHFASFRAWSEGDLEALRSSGDRARDEVRWMGKRWDEWEYLIRIELELISGYEADARALLAELLNGLRDPGGTDDVARSNAAAALITVAALTGDLSGVDRACSIARSLMDTPSAGALYVLIAQCALAAAVCLTGDRDDAQRLYEDSSWWRPTPAEGTMLAPGTLGRLAQYLGHSEEAVHHYRAGLESARTSCQLPTQVWASYELGQALLERGASGDRAEATRLLEEAQELARSKGLKLLVDTIGRSLGGETLFLPAGLTSREAETLRLLAVGKTDKEIAFELRITTRTASNHVGNILRKIGAGNRTEAARFAVRHGLAE